MDFKGIEKFAKENGIGLVVVGPEDPLAGGLVDRLTAAGIKTFGPTQEAARLEADKWFAKEVMRQQAVPTAEARSFTDASAAEEYVKNRNGEVVIKAAGLAKGKASRSVIACPMRSRRSTRSCASAPSATRASGW